MESFRLQQTANAVQKDLDLVELLATDYSESTVYLEGDIVLKADLDSSYLYMCTCATTKDDDGWVASHWKKADFLTIIQWIKKRLSEITVAEYVPSKAYNIGDKACYNGYVYEAIENIPAGSSSRTFDSNQWVRASIFTAGKGIEINAKNQVNAVGLTYTTTAPSAPNTSGDVKIVILDNEPTGQKQSGYLYFIKS